MIEEPCLLNQKLLLMLIQRSGVKRLWFLFIASKGLATAIQSKSRRMGLETVLFSKLFVQSEKVRAMWPLASITMMDNYRAGKALLLNPWLPATDSLMRKQEAAI